MKFKFNLSSNVLIYVLLEDFFVRQQFGGKLLPYHSLHSRWKFELELKLNWSGVGIEIARPKLKPVTESSDVGVDREIEKERAITLQLRGELRDQRTSFIRAVYDQWLTKQITK